ncbi:hypothetical protein [uncultured Roseivirga sp.]|uniref:hypothetical protein n=1 Tax=uncultured Roseivirga sp. TaxID=543088 RepID=UPI000D79345A|nr:hypothetical protein [uncultured Roseivirga sp.]PWL31088.1 MAG: hypothetical protein DCO95_06330 [Roseivirga sp. XM-24bin3]
MGVVEDIILVRNVVGKEWSDIIDTAKLINNLFNQAISKLGTCETEVKNDLETAWDDMVNLLQTIDASDLALILENVTLPSEVKQALDTLLSDLSSAESELDSVTKLLGSFPAIPGIPGLDGITAETFQSILEVWNEAGISVAVKKIKPRQTAPGPGQNAAEKDSIGLAEMLFSCFETSLGDFIENNASELTTLENNLKSAVGSGLWTLLETNITSAIESLINQKDSLTVDLFLTEFKNLISQEADIFAEKIEALKTNLTMTKTQFKDLLEGMLNVTAAEGEFADFYEDVMGVSTPTLQEAISFVIAVPLTLSAQATTGQNFPNNGVLKVQSSLDSIGREEMRAMVQITSIATDILDKAHSIYLSDKKEEASWVYKAVKGVVETIQSALIQYTWYPDSGGFFSGPNASNSIWGLQLITGNLFSLIQVILEVYWTKKNSTELAIKSLKESVPSFAENYKTYYYDLNTNYTDIVNKAKGKNVTIVPKDLEPISKSNDNISGVGTAFTNLTLPTSTTNVKEALIQLADLKFEKNTFLVLSSIKKQLKALSKASFITQDPAKTQYEAVTEALDSLIAERENLALLKQLGSMARDELTSGNVDYINPSDFLEFYCPIINIGTTVGYLVWKLVLTLEDEEEWETFDKASFTSALSIISSAAGIYDYKQTDKSELQEMVLSIINNSVFGLSTMYEMYEVKELIGKETSLKQVSASPGGTTVTIKFGDEVTMEKSTVAECFTITNPANASLTILSGTQGNGEGTYVLTMKDPLEAGTLTLNIVTGAFKGVFGNAVEGSKDFNVAVFIENYTLNRGSKQISLEFSTDIKVVGTLDTDSFSITGGNDSQNVTIGSVSKGNKESNFIIELNEALPALGQCTFKTKAGVFTTSVGAAFTASATINFTVLIKKTTLDTGTKQITIEFNTNVNAVGTLAPDFFTITGSTNVTAISIGSVLLGANAATYVIQLSGTLPTSGQYKVKTKSGVFQASGGTAVTAFTMVNFKSPS